MPGSTLSRRVAFITGGGSGIGLGIAGAFVDEGAAVALFSRNLERLEQARAQLLDRGAHTVIIHAGDVRDPQSVSAAMSAVVDGAGGIDVLVNNAAGNFVCPAESMSSNAWKSVVDIDLNGTFHCCQAAYPYLASSPYGGRIISIVSDQARHGWPGCAHAGAAKAGVVSLMHTLAIEWGPLGIRSNTIAPGPIEDTEGTRRLLGSEARRDLELSRIPLGRFGRVEDIASMAVYLASPAGDFINGADLVVDGGRTRTFAPVASGAAAGSGQSRQILQERAG